MPPLHSVNRFAILEDEINNINVSTSHEPIHKDILTPSKSTPRLCILKWECRLPKCYVVATTLGPKSLNLKVELQTTNTGKVFVMMHS